MGADEAGIPGQGEVQWEIRDTECTFSSAGN